MTLDFLRVGALLFLLVVGELFVLCAVVGCCTGGVFGGLCRRVGRNRQVLVAIARTIVTVSVCGFFLICALVGRGSLWCPAGILDFCALLGGIMIAPACGRGGLATVDYLMRMTAGVCQEFVSGGLVSISGIETEVMTPETRQEETRAPRVLLFSVLC